MQLTRGVAAVGGEGVDFPAAQLARKRRHGAQRLAERRAIIFGNPLAECQKVGVEDRLLIEQFQDFLHRTARRSVMQAHNHAAQLALAKGHEHAASGLRPLPDGLGQGIGEQLIERNGQTHVAERGTGVTDLTVAAWLRIGVRRAENEISGHDGGDSFPMSHG